MSASGPEHLGVGTLDPAHASGDVAAVRRHAATFGARPGYPTFGDRVRGFVRTYGWRAYALPVLTVVTVVALATAGGGKRVDTAARTSHHPTVAASAPPVAAPDIALKSDAPGGNVDDQALSGAALPAGAPYTTAGAGTFQVIRGSGPVVGTGPLHRYTVEVENGITGIDIAEYAALVQRVLSDQRSWSGHGVSLQRVDSGSVDFRVTLTSAMTVRALCGYDIPVETSCFAMTDPTTGATINRVVLNDARWVRGSAAYVGDVAAYRVYMINHEDGHALGHEHAHDCLPGGLAPVMMQQTIGLRSAVSHKLCAANPWPYPPGVDGTPGTEAPDTPQNNEFGLKND